LEVNVLDTARRAQGALVLQRKRPGTSKSPETSESPETSNAGNFRITGNFPRQKLPEVSEPFSSAGHQCRSLFGTAVFSLYLVFDTWAISQVMLGSTACSVQQTTCIQRATDNVHSACNRQSAFSVQQTTSCAVSDM
jgi:hypothetical protein